MDHEETDETTKAAEEQPSSVPEELRLLRDFMDRKGKFLLVACCMVLAALGAVALYRRQAADKIRRTNEQYFAAKSVAGLTSVIEEHPSVPAAPLSLLKIAKIQYDSGADFDAALSRYDDFIRRFPDHALVAVAEVGRLHCLEARQQQEDALSGFVAFAEKRPDHFLASQAVLGQARCLEALDRYDEAKAVYEEFIVGRPDSPWIPMAEELLRDIDARKRTADEMAKPAEPLPMPGGSEPIWDFSGQTDMPLPGPRVETPSAPTETGPTSDAPDMPVNETPPHTAEGLPEPAADTNAPAPVVVPPPAP